MMISFRTRNYRLPWIAMWLMVTPIMGLTIFGSIRMVNDLPSGLHYWDHNTASFLVREAIVLITGCMIMSAVLLSWLSVARKLKLGIAAEYGLFALFNIMLTICVVWINWHVTGRIPLWTDFVLPVVLSLLGAMMFYGFLKLRILQQDYSRQQIRLEQLRNDRLSTELKLLKAQYHPHFLFNALNTIYFQIADDNEAPRHTIEILSDLLRYQLNTQDNQVRLGDEATYLRRYIQMWRLRSPSMVRISFECSLSPADEKLTIHPMLMMPLVENAFKHSGVRAEINLRLHMETGRLVFRSFNTTGATGKDTMRRGTGLSNLRRRLDLLYPGRHILSTETDNNTFTAILTIQL